TVRVVDAAGEPLPDVPFALRGPAGAEPIDAIVEDGRSDAGGQARVGPLLAGRYTAVLRTPRRATQAGGSFVFTIPGGEGELAESAQTVEVRAGETAEVRLVRPALARVRGTVRDAGGPASGIEVKLSVTDQPGFG